ncbi:MAG: alpha/beta hydrolase [candidate division WOR-3 bacterium]
MIKRIKYKKVFFHYYNESQNTSAVLLLHGLGGTSFSFKKYFYILETQKIPFLASDHPFHGKTDEKDFFVYVDKIYEFLRKQGIDKIKIVSHSFGSFITELFYNRYKNFVTEIMLITPFIEAKKQTKGVGLFLYKKKYFFKFAGNILSIFPEKFKYPDYSKIRRKPYYAYWLNDMTHCDRKGYFDVQYFISDRKSENPEFLKMSEIHLGKYDVITYSDLTLKLLKKYQVKNITVHEGDHLLPLKEFFYFKDFFIKFVKQNG